MEVYLVILAISIVSLACLMTPVQRRRGQPLYSSVSYWGNRGEIFEFGVEPKTWKECGKSLGILPFAVGLAVSLLLRSAERGFPSSSDYDHS